MRMVFFFLNWFPAAVVTKGGKHLGNVLWQAGVVLLIETQSLAAVQVTLQITDRTDETEKYSFTAIQISDGFILWCRVVRLENLLLQVMKTCHPFFIQCIYSILVFFIKMSITTSKSPKWCVKKAFFLFDQQSHAVIHSVYYHIRQKKKTNYHIWEAKWRSFLFVNQLQIMLKASLLTSVVW